MSATVFVRCILLALAAATGTAAAPSPDEVLAGELARVDLTRRAASVKTDGGDARELEVVIGPETRIVARGRATRLEDLRPGDRIAVVAAFEGGRRVARVIRVVRRTAIPPPSLPAASPSPSVSAAPGAGTPPIWNPGSH